MLTYLILKKNLLDYFIPYFLQSFMLAYEGDTTPELDNAAN
jgi:spermidine/putrescine-binding protein